MVQYIRQNFTLLDNLYRNMNGDKVEGELFQRIADRMKQIREEDDEQ